MRGLFKVCLIVLLAFSACKDDPDPKIDTPTPGGIEDKLKSNLTVFREAAVTYDRVLRKSGDSLAALDSMRTWLANSPHVRDGWFYNEEFMEIEFSNGLKAPINIIPVGPDGEHLRRGGGVTSGLTALQLNSEGTMEIKNKKVLVLIPYPEEFRYYSSDFLNLELAIESSMKDMKADIIRGKDVDLQVLNSLGDYGFIILDVHGVTYGFNLFFLKETFKATDIWFPEEVIEEAFNTKGIPADKIANGQIEIGMNIFLEGDSAAQFIYTVIVTEEYIRQLPVDLSDAVLFGNHCFSGHTLDGPNKNNLPEAWRSRGLATYYGYALEGGRSIPVDNDFCKDMELLLIEGLLSDKDSTGAAHLRPDGSEPSYNSKKGYTRDRSKFKELTPLKPEPPLPLYLTQYFARNYAYETCKTGKFTDSRDGEVYKTVEIGEQVWMAENLRYLPFVHTRQEFKDAKNNLTKAYAVYGYNGTSVSEARSQADFKTYGVLYNWFAVMDGASPSSSVPSGVQGVCPSGWHVPSLEEWRTLAKFTGLSSEAGSKLKSSDYWNSPSTSSNEFCFSAVPTGYRSQIARMDYDRGGIGKHWTTTEANTDVPYSVGFSATASSFQAGGWEWGDGVACRCVKD